MRYASRAHGLESSEKGVLSCKGGLGVQGGRELSGSWHYTRHVLVARLQASDHATCQYDSHASGPVRDSSK